MMTVCDVLVSDVHHTHVLTLFLLSSELLYGIKLETCEPRGSQTYLLSFYFYVRWACYGVSALPMTGDSLNELNQSSF